MKRDFGKPLTRAERRRAAERLALQEAELIEEIAEAAEKIGAATGPSGEPAYRTDPVEPRLLEHVTTGGFGPLACCSASIRRGC